MSYDRSSFRNTISDQNIRKDNGIEIYIIWRDKMVQCNEDNLWITVKCSAAENTPVHKHIQKIVVDAIAALSYYWYKNLLSTCSIHLSTSDSSKTTIELKHSMSTFSIVTVNMPLTLHYLKAYVPVALLRRPPPTVPAL